MNVFRLVLCLAGLAAYLITKQTLPSSQADILPTTIQGSKPSESKQHAEQNKCDEAVEAKESTRASRQTAEAKQ
jgi:hypothetical protein